MSVKITGDLRPDGKIGAKPIFGSTSPEIEARIQAAHGTPTPNFWENTREVTDSFYRRLTRDFEWLPRGAEYAQLRFDLKVLLKYKDVAGDRTLRLLQGITVDFKDDPQKFKLFERKVLLNDLAEEASLGHELPFGYTLDTLKADIAKLNDVVNQYPEINKAITKRKRVHSAVIADLEAVMKAIGHPLKDVFTKKDYFRHQVLEHANTRWLVGKKKLVPTGRDYMKHREGSTLDINTHYLEAEYEVLTRMIHDTHRAQFIEKIKNNPNYNILPELKAEATKMGADTWQSLIPDGYSVWQPKEGNYFYFAPSIPARIAMELNKGMLKEVGVKAEDIKKILAVGQALPQLVVKDEVVRTLDDIVKELPTDPVSRLAQSTMQHWKRYQLQAPHRITRYFFRNISGDAEPVFVGNPSTFKKLPQAITELHNVYFGDKAMSETMRDAFDRGLLQSTLQVQEIGDVNRLKMFATMLEAKGSLKEIPARVLQGYWKAARLSNDFREAALRYAAYIDYLEQIRADITKGGTGVPKNFGASLREEVMALKDPKDRAFLLANDLLGAYDSIGVTGRWLRNYMMPFVSWKEINIRRSWGLYQNAVYDEKLAQTVGRSIWPFLARSPVIAIRLGTFAMKVMAMWSVLQAYNHTRFPEEVKELSDSTRARPFLIFGRGEDGKVLYIDRLGAFSDLWEWVARDAPSQVAKDFFSGRKTLVETAKESFVKTPINVLAQLLGPHIKMPAELITNKKFFPSVWEPRTIKDEWHYLAQSFGLTDVYANLRGLPKRPGALTRMVFLTQPPGQAAYFNIRNEKRSYLDKIGRAATAFRAGETERGTALRYVKLSVRYGDAVAFRKYLLEYALLGGTRAGLSTAFRNMDPLHGLNDVEEKDFTENWLDDEGRRDLKVAQNYYRENILTFQDFFDTN